MYEGPGAGSMLTAANAWDGVAAVLNSAATSYATVLAGLSVESWLGPASASMAAAVAPYAGWLSTAALLTERTATQARTAAAAYETAFAMTVPPPLISANREQLMSLAATNLLGQNSPAIEALQAEYAEMWAQDAAAMFAYAASSEAAAALPSFTAPAQAADPAGPAAAAAAAQQTAMGLLSSISAQTLQGLAELISPAASLTQASAAAIPTPIGDLDIAAAYIAITATASLSLSAVNTARPWIYSYGNTSKPQPGDDAVQPTEGSTLGSRRDAEPSVGTAPAAAGVGQAALVGALTVPHSWTVAAPEIRLAVQSLPGAGAAVGPAPVNLGAAPAALLGGMALAGMAGRGGTGPGPASPEVQTEEDGQPKRKPTVVVIQQPPAGPGPMGNRPQ
ncbi:PPE family protein [Mycobacterium sp. TY815]|uniref:PPE family protein n=1 Tax=unclassified Mycobacterium TaxID=2642494 RepID=UPI003532284C